MKRILIAGESWVTHSIHQKGFDWFATTSYTEGVGPLRAALEGAGLTVDFLPNHLAPTKFPSTASQLDAYSCVILSDIGTNTLLLHPDTFDRGRPTPNRLTLLRQYVERGGGLIMVGGYMTFQGIEGKARWAGTEVEKILPVKIQTSDDRVECPEGIPPRAATKHPIAQGLPREWPVVLGYNKVALKRGATLVASVGKDVLLACGKAGRGRTVAFTTDCGPHWCPPEFLAWDGYNKLWPQMARWTGGEI